jgi:hypothetical protein
MFVDERFYLKKSTVDKIKAIPVKFGFDGFGALVYFRSYSRIKEDGSQENWHDTVIRNIQGVMSIRKDWYKKIGVQWVESDWQNYAEGMAIAMTLMQWTPPGRGLFICGTDYMYQRGSASSNNCAAITVFNHSFAKTMAWITDGLMNGIGVAADAMPGPALKVYRPRGEPSLHVISDDREGWVQSVEVLLDSYLKDGSHPVCFDYSLIRKAGAPIRGFGGVASGPEALQKLHSRMRNYMEDYADGKTSRTRLVIDLTNAIGCMVVAGGVRRSSELILGDPNDLEFHNLKNYEKYPERREIGWVSNNSLLLSDEAHYEMVPGLVDRIFDNGEPGIFNLMNVQKYGRTGEFLPDNANLANPCQPSWATVLTSTGISTIGQIRPGDTIWSGKQWTVVTNKVKTGVKPVLAYKTRAGTFYGTAQHRVVSGGIKVQVQNAESIDISQGPGVSAHGDFDLQSVMDGLVLGDGSVHKASDNLIYLYLGVKDQDCFKDPVAYLLTKHRPGIKETAWEVKTNLLASELPLTYLRKVPDRYRFADLNTVRSFLRGIYSANGSICGPRITLKASSFHIIEAVQEMLSALGIASYYITNSAQDVQFKNGIYTCRESYDLNISTSSSKKLFLALIGFIQGYKQDKLMALCGKPISKYSGGSGPKSTFEIVEIESLGEEDVFDITVAAEEHTYWTGGLLVSNCGESVLFGGVGDGGELCDLADVTPARCNTRSEFLQACDYATFFASTISLLPTHWPGTNKIIEQNRRIGVSMMGIADSIDSIGMNATEAMLRQGYNAVVYSNQRWAKDANVRESIRKTVEKPNGSSGFVVGTSPGAHHPTFSKAARRIRIGSHTPIAEFLKKAGCAWEPDIYSDQTDVFIFPIDHGTTRPATEVSLLEQFETLQMVQRAWADQSCSITLYADPDKDREIAKHVLLQGAKELKTLSMLPHTKEGVYAQSPYSGLTDQEFQDLKARTPVIDWSLFFGSDGMDEKFCNNGVCELPIRS